MISQDQCRHRRGRLIATVVFIMGSVTSFKYSAAIKNAHVTWDAAGTNKPTEP
jgi:cytochrome c2